MYHRTDPPVGLTTARSGHTQLLGGEDPVLKPEYFTEAAGTKAFIATGTVFTSTLAQSACSTVPAICGFISWVPDQLALLVGMMMLDMATGVLAARSEGQRVTSKRLGEGMKRKVGILFIIASTVLLEGLFSSNGLPLSGLLFKWTATWFICVEALSLYENADRMGVPIPAFLKKTVEKMLQKAEDTVGEEKQDA